MKIFNFVVAVVVAGVLFAGCAVKEIVDIKPYESKYAEESVNKKIELIAVNDKRKTDIVSTVIEAGKVKNKYKTSADLESWFKDALMKDLSTAGIKNMSGANTTLEVNILKLDTVFSYDIAKNLTGSVELELVFKNDGTTYKKFIKHTYNKFKGSMIDAQSFEEFVYDNLSDSVVNSIKATVMTLKDDTK